MIRASDYFDPAAYESRLARNRQVWHSFLARRSRKMPVFMNLCAPFLCDLFGVRPDRYYTDLEVMAETQLAGIAWHLEHLDDDELPTGIFLDAATVHEAIVFDGKITYPETSPPWMQPILRDIDDVDELTSPDFSYHQRLADLRERTHELSQMVDGVPVRANVHLHAPFTMAAQLLGAEKLYLACYEEPEKVHKLLDYCLRAFRQFEQHRLEYMSPDGLDEFVCWREPQAGLRRVWLSDDSAVAISPHLYEAFVKPYNDELFTDYDLVHLHMDGEWNHLIPYLQQYGVEWMEVGRETDWVQAVIALGSQTVLQGGIPGELAREGTPAECAHVARQRLEEAAGQARVVLTIPQEAYPGTPLENMQAIIATARAFAGERH